MNAGIQFEKPLTRKSISLSFPNVSPEPRQWISNNALFISCETEDMYWQWFSKYLSQKCYNGLQSSSTCHPSVLFFLNLCFHMIRVVFAKCANRTRGTRWPYKCHTNTVWERLTVRPRKWPCLFIFFPTFCRRSFQEWIIALGNSKFKHMLLFYRNIAVWGRWPYLGDM